MSRVLYNMSETAVEDAVITFDDDRVSVASVHQISVTKDGGAAGTLGVEVKPLGTSRWEDLTEGGTPVAIDMTADESFPAFEGAFSAIRLTPTAFDGDGYTVTISGW
jgi:hypothetical protein